jgi:hypothetical protein
MTIHVPTASISSDSTSRFAADLRELQRTSGDLTGVALAHQAQLSKTVVADALAGKKLPSERTVAHLARALGCDGAVLIDRRNALYEQLTRATTSLSPIAVEGDPAEDASEANANASASSCDIASATEGALGNDSDLDADFHRLDDDTPRRASRTLGLGVALLLCLATAVITAGVTASAVLALTAQTVHAGTGPERPDPGQASTWDPQWSR